MDYRNLADDARHYTCQQQRLFDGWEDRWDYMAEKSLTAKRMNVKRRTN